MDRAEETTGGHAGIPQRAGLRAVLGPLIKSPTEPRSCPGIVRLQPQNPSAAPGQPLLGATSVVDHRRALCPVFLQTLPRPPSAASPCLFPGHVGSWPRPPLRPWVAAPPTPMLWSRFCHLTPPLFSPPSAQAACCDPRISRLLLISCSHTALRNAATGCLLPRGFQ